MSRRRLESDIQAAPAVDIEKKWEHCSDSSDHCREFKPQMDKEGVFSLQYSYDGQTLAVGYGNAAVEILDAVTGKLRSQVVKSRYGGLAVTSMRFSPANQHLLYTAAADGVVLVANTTSGENRPIIEERGNQIFCLDFSKDGYSFATAGKDFAVRIYDTHTTQLSRTFDGFSARLMGPDDGPYAHVGRVFALKWHTEYDHIFVTAGWDDSIKIWDVRSNQGVVRYISGPHVCGDALDVRGFQILTGSWKGNDALQIWDYSEGKLLKSVPYQQNGDGEFLYCAQFVNEACVAAGGSGTNNVQIININTDKCIGKIQMSKPVQALDTTCGGAQIAVGAVDSSLKIAKV